MTIDCLHGYFIFREDRSGEISEFMSLYDGLVLEKKDDYYTFSSLVAAPEYSVAGVTYLGAQTTETYEGKPWEIFEANGLIYNFELDQVQLINEVTQRVSIKTAKNYFITPGLILPGAVTEDGTRVTDYAARYSFLKFRYSEVTFV